tara:strand:+ start:752 stop:910 length:159 start_codon:yes stop_codon:yes gene_type:complete
MSDYYVKNITTENRKIRQLLITAICVLVLGGWRNDSRKNIACLFKRKDGYFI